MTEEVTTGKSLYALKFTVISLGIALVGGIIMLFAMLYQHSSKLPAKSCVMQNITLPVIEEVVSMQQEGERITLLTKVKKGVQQLLVINGCTGLVDHSITLVRGNDAGK